jgi:hypothetical protein
MILYDKCLWCISNQILTSYRLCRSTTYCLNLRGIVNWLTALCRWLNHVTSFKASKTMVYFKKCVDTKKLNSITGHLILPWIRWLTKRSRIADIERIWGAVNHGPDPAISTILDMLIIKINSLNSSERVQCKSHKKKDRVLK